MMQDDAINDAFSTSGWIVLITQPGAKYTSESTTAMTFDWQVADAALMPAFAAIILGLALRPSWTRVLEFWPLVLLGDASYSFYLLHANLIGMVFQPTGEPSHLPVWKIIAGLLVPVTVSILVYKFIEQPARRKLLGKKKRELEVASAIAATA